VAFERNVIETCGLRRNVEKTPVHHMHSLKSKILRVFYFRQSCFAKICRKPHSLTPFNSINCEIILEYFTPVEEICPSFFEYPSRPILSNHIRFIYSNKITIENLTKIPLTEYVCYDEKLCGKIYPIEIVYNNLTCRHFNQFQLNENKSFSSFEMLIEAMKIPFLKCLPIFNELHYCNHSTMYQCYNSTKCISKYKLLDSYSDCSFNDDETYNQSCLLDNTNYLFRCLVNNNEKCFAPLAIRKWS
jgi:hypothetical protein